MIFNEHSKLVGQHAFLSASKYSWLGYDEDKLRHVFITAMKTKRGTELHDLAHRLIRLREKLPNSLKTLNMFVNDAIGYRMISEQVLYYSPSFFGTADAISFRRNRDTGQFILRISDLKTGDNRTSHKQLIIYAALFCLEYGYDPNEIDIELRIYQHNEIDIYEPDGPEIKYVMQKIIRFDEILKDLTEEVSQ